MNARKLMLVLLASLVIVFGAAGFGTYYAYGMLQENVRAANHVKIDAELNDQAQASLQNVQKQFSDPAVEKLLTAMSQVIPPDSYRSQFVADLYKYASDGGISVTGITFLDKGVVATITPAGVVTMPLTITIGAGSSYDNFTAFVKKLENNLQHVQVNTLTMQPDANSPDLLSSASLNVEVFIKKK